MLCIDMLSLSLFFNGSSSLLQTFLLIFALHLLSVSVFSQLKTNVEYSQYSVGTETDAVNSHQVLSKFYLQGRMEKLDKLVVQKVQKCLYSLINIKCYVYIIAIFKHNITTFFHVRFSGNRKFNSENMIQYLLEMRLNRMH